MMSETAATLRRGFLKVLSPGTRAGRWLAAMLPLLLPSTAAAHTTEQSFVLLLPTELYISTGVVVVALTVLTLAFAPSRIADRVFATISLPAVKAPGGLMTATSLVSLLLLLLLVAVGITGPHDPFENPLPLGIWTVWWMGLLFVQGVVGDVWSWVNPWTGIHRLIFGQSRAGLLPELPDWAASLIAIATLVAFHMLVLADPAPDEPPRLAGFVIGYWLFTFIGMILFGSRYWLGKCECFSVLFGLITRISPLRLSRHGSGFGMPGWQLPDLRDPSTGVGLFCLVALGTGSFDGLNETFWWLSVIGVNPLEFPGRSAIIAETVAGILAAPALLVLVFGICVWAGAQLAGPDPTAAEQISFSTAFRRLAISVLPIALGYHFAHYLTAFMVNIQYTVAALSDPFHSGADYLGLGRFYVTTGFFNDQDSVRIILLSQCFAVVLGHVIAVFAAHEIAKDLFGSGRRATLSQLPVSVFMILYTLLSLWLLASPRGA